MLALVAVHFVAAALAPGLVRRMGRNAFLVLALVPGSAAVWALGRSEVLRGGILRDAHAWAPSYGLDLTFSLELLALLLAVLVGGVGALVLVYCARYFQDGEAGLGAFAGELVAFAGAMLGLVLVDNLILLYVFWELTTVFSYLLIGHHAEARESRRAALQALIVTTLGGLALLVGLIMLGSAAGTYDMTEVLTNPPSGAPVTVALVLVLVGALSKSAIFPFSLWLPGAMAAPTPVSAYLHAAAMVKAGVYLIAWLAPTFATVGPWRPIVLTLGVATMLLGGWRACREHDLKRLLAFGTVSQLGFLTVLVGAGTRDAALAGAMMLLAHALFKATLFLVVGVIDHQTGSRDLRELSGLRRTMPATFVAAALAAASMAGLPPLAGFVGKEAALEAFLHGGWPDTLVLAGLVAGSVLTVAYSARFVWGAFAVKPGRRATQPKPAGWLFLAPAAVLSVGGLVLGVLADALDPTLAQYADQYAAAAEPYHLALWHGLTPALGLSALVVTAGAVLFAARERLVRLQLRLRLVDAEVVYQTLIAGLERLALQLTGHTQRGSLPLYLNITVTVLIACVGAALLAGGADLLPPSLAESFPGGLRWIDNWPQVGAVVLVAAAALLTLRVTERLRAVVLVGITGYGTAMLFLFHGAPELALTQLLVETVSLVVFVLVMRRLPVRFTGSFPRWRRQVHAVLGTLAGALIGVVLFVAASARQAPPISEQFPAAAEEAGASNIISAILVDLRAWDTLGETSVLALAAAGVTSLVFLRRRTRVIPRVGQPGVSGQVWAVTTPGQRPATQPPTTTGDPAGTGQTDTGQAGARTSQPTGQAVSQPARETLPEPPGGRPQPGDAEGGHETPDGGRGGEDGRRASGEEAGATGRQSTGRQSSAGAPAALDGGGEASPAPEAPASPTPAPTAPASATSTSATSASATSAGASGSGDRPRRASWLRASATLASERRSVVFEVVTRLMFHPILLLSLYLLFLGHSLPGGGFNAGIVAGLALVIRYLAGGRYELGEAAPVDAGLLLGVGMTVAATTALGGLVLGGDILASTVLHASVPLLGEIHLATSLFFDIGVYLVVIGVVLDILRSLGAAVDWQMEHEDRPEQWEDVTP